MGRGFLSGVFWGLILSAVVLSVTALFTTDPIDAPAPQATELDMAPTVAPEADAETASQTPSTDATVATGTSGSVEAPTLEETPATTLVDTDPGVQPKNGDDPAGLAAAPADTGAQSELSVASEEPVESGATTALPTAPIADTSIIAPAQPEKPSAETLPTVQSEVEPGDTSPEVEASSGVEAAPALEIAPTVEASAADALPSIEAPAADVAPAPSTVEPEAAVEVPTAEENEAVAPAATEAGEIETAVVLPAEESAPETEQADPAAPEADTAAEAVENTQDEEAEAEAKTGVTTSRLPRIGVTIEEDAEEATEEETEEVVESEAPQGLLPALQANSAAFENPDAKPLMSVVLMQVGGRPADDVLAQIDFPLTFAVDPASPGAAEAAAFYRSAGFEVVMLVSLPKSAAPSDVEVTFQTYMQRLPQAVAVLDAPGGGIQSSRDMVKQVVDILKDTGHGLVTYPRGLNTARQIADREGVANKLVFRAFDAAGETPAVMRRFLDQAAFRAGQEGGVIMVGQTQPDTLAALIEWSQGGRAGSVILAPLSAVLIDQ